MYIIAIAWMYVVVLMAATEKSVTAGLLTFIFYGTSAARGCAGYILLPLSRRRWRGVEVDHTHVGSPLALARAAMLST